MANKKPTITLGKGTPASSAAKPVSAKPSDASKLNAAKRTTSSGITTRPDGRRQSEGRSGRQSISKATVSTSGQGVTPGSAGGRVTTGQSRTSSTTNTIRATGGNSNYSKINRLSETTAQPKPTAVANLAKSQQMLRSQVWPLVNGARGLGIQAIAETVAPRPASARAGLKEGQAAANSIVKAKGKTADSFGGQYQKGKAAPSKAPKSQTKAQSFDNAFASARNSGMSSFVWDGKRYTTQKK